MKKINVQDAIGMELCHDITEMDDGFKGVAFKRGYIIREEDIDHMLRIGKQHIFVCYARGRAYDPNRYPVTPYRDPNAKVEKTPEVTELTEEEKNILAEENPTLLEAATVETPVEETVAVETTAVEADTAASEETDAEGDYEAPYAEEEDDTKN